MLLLRTRQSGWLTARTKMRNLLVSLEQKELRTMVLAVDGWMVVGGWWVVE